MESDVKPTEESSSLTINNENLTESAKQHNLTKIT